MLADADKRFNKVQIGGISYEPNISYKILVTLDAKNLKQ
jgi:hypothetical protein